MRKMLRRKLLARNMATQQTRAVMSCDRASWMRGTRVTSAMTQNVSTPSVQEAVSLEQWLLKGGMWAYR